MKIALLGVFPILPFARQLGIHNPPLNTTSWNVNLAEGLGDIKGNDVHFITVNPSIRRDTIIKSGGVKIHFLSSPKRLRLFTLFQFNKFKIHRELSRIRPDIVHGNATEHEYPYIAVTSPFPNIVTLQNYMPFLIRERGWGPLFSKAIFFVLEKYVLRNARYIISTTHFLDQAIQGHTHAKRFIINNSVSPIYFSKKKKRATQILFIGYIRPEKGVHTLIEAFNKIRFSNRDVKLKIVGPPAKPFPGYYRKVKDLSASGEKDGQIVFTGYMYPKEILDELSKSFFLVLPSFHEPFGVVLVEALASATPVIATQVGGIPYVIDDGKTGFLVKPGDVQALAEKMSMLLKNNGLRNQMGYKGREDARKRFHPSIAAKNTMAIYKEIVNAWKQ